MWQKAGTDRIPWNTSAPATGIDDITSSLGQDTWSLILVPFEYEAAVPAKEPRRSLFCILSFYCDKISTFMLSTPRQLLFRWSNQA
jgi:hypothetical protein